MNLWRYPELPQTIGAATFSLSGEEDLRIATSGPTDRDIRLSATVDLEAGDYLLYGPSGWTPAIKLTSGDGRTSIAFGKPDGTRFTIPADTYQMQSILGARSNGQWVTSPRLYQLEGDT